MKTARWGLAAILAALLIARLAITRRDVAGPLALIEQTEIADYGPAPDFSLIDQDGKPFSRSQLDGKPWVGAFIFTACGGQCPLMTMRMKQAAARLPGVRFVSFSVDPRDSPADLKRYAASYGADWIFLTGRGKAVRELSVKGFKLTAQEGGPPREPILHSNRLVLVDRYSRIRGYFIADDPSELERLIALASRL